jgi:hypothetical protein
MKDLEDYYFKCKLQNSKSSLQRIGRMGKIENKTNV